MHVAIADLLELDLDAGLLLEVGQHGLDDMGFRNVLHEGMERHALGMRDARSGGEPQEAGSGKHGTEFQHFFLSCFI